MSVWVRPRMPVYDRQDPYDRPARGIWVADMHPTWSVDEAYIVWPGPKRANKDANGVRRKRQRGGQNAPSITADYRAGRIAQSHNA